MQAKQLYIMRNFIINFFKNFQGVFNHNSYELSPEVQKLYDQIIDKEKF